MHCRTIIPFCSVALALVLGSRADCQASDSSVRVAAFRFAIANGLPLPGDSIVVAHDPNVGYYTAPAITKAELAIAADEARQMAQIFGPGAGTAPAKEVLQCPRYDCATSKRLTVVVVTSPGLPSDGRHTVNIYLYAPGARSNERARSLSAVIVVRDGAGWRGDSFRFKPSVIMPVRVTPLVARPSSEGPLTRGATTDEQQALELAAARYVVAASGGQSGLAGFAIDPREYAPFSWDAAPKREDVYVSGMVDSHSAVHLTEVGRILGTSSVVDDSKACMVFRPSACRAASHAGSVSLSAASFRGDTAQITVFRITRRSVAAGVANQSAISGWSLKLIMTNSAWRIISSRTHSDTTP